MLVNIIKKLTKALEITINSLRKVKPIRKIAKKFNKKLNLKNPKTFNEKLQWIKLYDRNPKYSRMVDKYEAKKYVSEIIGEEYIIPTYGVYDCFDEINFDALPQQFVMKCTHISGSVIVCKDKSNFDFEKAKKEITQNLNREYFKHKREWPYKNVKPRIIIEKYMATEEQKELVDYKFFCFNGIPKLLNISEGWLTPSTVKMDFLDTDYNPTDFYRTDHGRFDKLPVKPVNFEKMKEISKKLAEDTNFIRVDLYEINGKIYFSELTFFPCGGFIPFEPEEYDLILGNMITLPEKKIKG